MERILGLPIYFPPFYYEKSDSEYIAYTESKQVYLKAQTFRELKSAILWEYTKETKLKEKRKCKN